MALYFRRVVLTKGGPATMSRFYASFPEAQEDMLIRDMLEFWPEDAYDDILFDVVQAVEYDGDSTVILSPAASG